MSESFQFSDGGQAGRASDPQAEVEFACLLNREPLNPEIAA
jgi:hypothetical protein